MWQSWDKFWQVIGGILILIAIGAVIYFEFFRVQTYSKPMTAQEQKRIEQNLIKQYGSLEEAEKKYEEQTQRPEFCDSKTGCW